MGLKGWIVVFLGGGMGMKEGERISEGRWSEGTGIVF